MLKDGYDLGRQNIDGKLEKDGQLFRAVWLVRASSVKHKTN